MHPCLILKMDVILIAAITADGYIARQSNEIINWTKDLALFKKQTQGWPVIMGSNTYDTLAADLEEREMIVVNRGDDPEKVLSKIKQERCFIIGGGRTYTKFAKHLTHLYLTPHPLVFGGGIPIFPELDNKIDLVFERLVPVDETLGIYQFQYAVVK